MNELQIFKNPEFGQVRFVEIDSKPYAVASDVARVLGYERPGNAISSHCRSTLKYSIPHPQNNSKTLEVNVIPEGDIYRLIIRSKLKEAERFETWVFDEVLPALRQQGSYSIQQHNSSLPQLPQTFQECLRLYADSLDANERLTEENLKLLPKAEQYDDFMETTGTQDIGAVAKALGTGRTRLFELLRTKGILMWNNLPYQQYINQGYFTVKETIVYIKDIPRNNAKTLVTTKGIDWISRVLREA